MAQRSGFVAIFGRPNVGKSTLLCTILGEKIAAITPKPQTTRRRLRGFKTTARGQIVLVDTPGMFDGKRELAQFMQKEVWAAAADELDVSLYVVDVTRPSKRDGAHVERLSRIGRPVVLALNKIDRVGSDQVAVQAKRCADYEGVHSVSAVSALNRSGVDPLIETLFDILPEGPLYYPPDLITDQSVRAIVAEFIREQIMLHCRQELPYSAAVDVEQFKEDPDLVRIWATIHVERQSQKGIVIGKGGSMLKRIGTTAREQIEQFLGRQVFLKLFVRVEPDWTRKEKSLRKLGYK